MIHEEARPPKDEKLQLELDETPPPHAQWQHLDLGNEGLLTDALKQSFSKIEKDLARFSLGKCSPEEIEDLRNRMKILLSKMNASPYLPLAFRMKVLLKFEEYSSLFDADLTTAFLCSHRLGIELILSEAEARPYLYRWGLKLANQALLMAIGAMRFRLNHHLTLPVRATHEALAIIRLGLAASEAATEDAMGEKKALLHSIATHELYRRMDWHGMSKEMKLRVSNEMPKHIHLLAPTLLRVGDPMPEGVEPPIMLTHLGKPHVRPEVVQHIPKERFDDIVFMSLKRFYTSVNMALQKAQRLSKDIAQQARDLQTEESLKDALIGGKAILQSLVSKPRSSIRKPVDQLHLLIETDAAKAFLHWYRGKVGKDAQIDASNIPGPLAWSVTDLSQGGVGLERMSTMRAKEEIIVDAIVGLHWSPHKHDLPLLGFVRWHKRPKEDVEKVGIEFLREDFALVQVRMRAGGDAEWMEDRSFPILVRKGTKTFALFPFKGMVRGSVFFVLQRQEPIYFHIDDVLSEGPNYTLCTFSRTQLGEGRS